MGQFLSIPTIEPVPGREDLFTVMSPLLWLNEDKSWWYIAPGYETDGASIPRWAWAFVGHPLQGQVLGPAILHDGLYSLAESRREDCDLLFAEAMEQQGVAWWKRQVFYRAVRVSGAALWAANTPETIAAARLKVKYIPRKAA